MPLHDHPHRRAVLGFIVLAAALVLVYYLPTLMTQVNGGAGHPWTDDVGEFQVALNIWGTVHATGYPLFLMIGNGVTTVFRALGTNPAAAASLYAMIWSLIALGLFYGLVLRLTGRIEIAFATTFLVGVTRSIWIHSVVAEEYGMNSAIELALLAIVVWPPGITTRNMRRRVWLLALVGGIGVAHHRTILFMAPGLLWAVWPCLRALERRKQIITLAIALLIGLIGFVPYLYLPARAWAHGDFVYGDPGTLAGFWDQFTGKEAAYLGHLPPTPQAWLDDFVDTFRILIAELTPIPALCCAVGAVIAMLRSRFRREARIAFICTWLYFLFLFVFHDVVKPQAVAMPIVLVLVLEFALALDMAPLFLLPRWQVLWVIVVFILAALCIQDQSNTVRQIAHDDSGLKMIELAKEIPRDGGRSVLMLPWGPRYHAVAYSKYITKENADLPLVDHNARFGDLVAQGRVIYTSKDTFYQFGLAWWDEQLGHAYLSSAGDGLVTIRNAPLIQTGESGVPFALGVTLRNFAICTDDQQVRLTITWSAERKPDADLSVFVKLFNKDGGLVGQADSSAPVYGRYPTSRWSVGEIVYDTYVLPRTPDGVRLSFGMYTQPSPQKFINYGTQDVPVLSVFRCTSS